MLIYSKPCNGQSKECEEAKNSFKEALKTFKDTHKDARAAKLEALKAVNEEFRNGDIDNEQKRESFSAIISEYLVSKEEAKLAFDEAKDLRSDLCDAAEEEESEGEESEEEESEDEESASAEQKKVKVKVKDNKCNYL